MTTYNYTFDINLSSGGSAPTFNVTGGALSLPVNTMQPLLNPGDTITFNVGGRAVQNNECFLYLRPLASNQAYPFSNATEWQIPITGANQQYATVQLTAQNSGPLSFAVGGVYQSAENSAVLIPFVVDPECEVGSSG